jgi:DNA-binding MarR family transcriptional regulator
LSERYKSSTLAIMASVLRRSVGRRPAASTRPPALPASFDSLEQEAYLQLWRTYDRLRELDERVFSRHGISAQQYNALRVLRAVSPRPLATSALGARLVSRAPDMTRMLDKLEGRRLVRRRRSVANRRLVEVSITPAGRALVARLADAVRQCGHDQLGHLDRRALRSLIDLHKQARGPHDRDAADAWPGNQPSRP